MYLPNLFSQPGGGQSSDSLVQQQPEWKLPPTITPTVATGIPDPLGGMSDKLEGKSQALGMMLYALGGALRGDKDFVLKTLKLQDLQEGKKKQEEKKKAFQDLLKSMEGNYDQRMIDFAKVLGYEKGSDLLMSTFTKKDGGTAKQKEYSQLQSILEDPNKSPEEKALAKKFFAGITGGKSKEQTIRELVASLAKTINPYTQQLYTPDEISAQIQQIDPLLSGTYGQQSPQPAPRPFGYKNYKITPEG